jgi:Helicase conserved C-terminal domain
METEALAARDTIERSLRRELFGPQDGDPPNGKPLRISRDGLHFASWEDARGPWHEDGSGAEILHETDPDRRYGVGILHPAGERPDPNSVAGQTSLPQGDREVDEPAIEIESAGARGRGDEPADDDDFDLADANAYQPRAMAVSFRARLPEGAVLAVEASLGRYDPLTVRVEGVERPLRWWVRRPAHLAGSIQARTLTSGNRRHLRLEPDRLEAGPLVPGVEVFSRQLPGEPDPEVRLITVALTNRTRGAGAAACLFQAGFLVRAAGGALIEAYPAAAGPAWGSEEDQSTALLYRDAETHAVGHGCAAGWGAPAGGSVTEVRAEAMPAFDVPSLTPSISTPEGELRASMRALAADDTAAADGQVRQLLEGYRDWISARRAEAAGLPDRYRQAAARHLDSCQAALSRMERGWQLAQHDQLAATAFRLANEAMLVQQVRSRLPQRDVRIDESGRLHVAGTQPSGAADPAIGYWRPFQVGFLLASLEALAYPQAADRDIVDLIFFPTGGGKTEAYLGAAAISMIARRLRDPSDGGTDVLMRYTLRLLTAQQFLRAASLLCALEDLRGRRDDLGDEPFSIGIWLGAATTPNDHEIARQRLSALTRDPRAENPFLLLRCPWCGTRMGPVRDRPAGRRSVPPPGYELSGNKVILACPDVTCRFGGRSRLPVYVVDSDIYSERPSLVIGTVDKFAMLTWRPQSRSLFGIAASGDRVSSPPNLIIQDELHLIAGPLGSVAGLYEAVIDDLCTDHRHEPPVRTKIIASTATIRRYGEQVRALYGRQRVALFPPPGLKAGESYFASTAIDESGCPLPGRRHIGIHAPSLGSIQTAQVRVAAALLQAPLGLPDSSRDPYWTNLWFFNSLRELGNTVSLLQSDIPDYLTGMRTRDGLAQIRWPRHTMELTSRRRNDEIPRAIDELSTAYGAYAAVDICLASSIIEVGIDIDRLSLMTIVGQPKTTAQYIQVSGRIGRQWRDRPGLVVMIYGATKPRDRSHFERFRSYHERLYAEVEPTSLTPFALPVLNRALHAAMVAHVRLASPAGISPYPYPGEAAARAAAVLRERAQASDPGELPELESVLRRRQRQWREWERTAWDANPVGGNPVQGLMRYAGTAEQPDIAAPSWEVPTSMRSVDAECEVRISTAYALAAGDREGDAEA